MSFADYFSNNYMTLMTISGLVLLMFVNRDTKIPASRYFCVAIMLLLAITVADYFGNYYKFLTVTEPDMTPLAIERRYIWDTLSYIIRPVIILIEVLVILPDKKYKYLCILPVVVNGIIYSTRFFGSDLTFGLGEDNIFHEGPLHITVFVVQLIYLLLLLIFSLISFKQNVRQSIMIFGILAQAVIAALGEYVFQYDYDLSAQVTAFCILEYYMYLTAVYQREIRETALEKERDSARNELLVLKNQIQPHFIYNTLSIIRSLIRSDKAKAADEEAEFELPHNGIGIENTRKRLQIQCDSALEIEITDHGSTAEIRLPRKVCEINENTYS